MAAGEEILSYCTSCKLDLRHLIVAHKTGSTGAVAKVECKTCRKIHAYHAPKGAAGVVTVKQQHEKGPKRVKAEVIPLSVEWNKQLGESKDKASRTYSMAHAFGKGDLLEHPNFGVGVVQNVKDPTKVEVLFENSLKVLIHNKKV